MSGGLPSELREAFGRLVLCRRCKGRGSMTVVARGKGRPTSSTETTCPTCGGRGLVEPARGWGKGYAR